MTEIQKPIPQEGASSNLLQKNEIEWFRDPLLLLSGRNFIPWNESHPVAQLNATARLAVYSLAIYYVIRRDFKPFKHVLMALTAFSFYSFTELSKHKVERFTAASMDVEEKAEKRSFKGILPDEKVLKKLRLNPREAPSRSVYIPTKIEDKYGRRAARSFPEDPDDVRMFGTFGQGPQKYSINRRKEG